MNHLKHVTTFCEQHNQRLEQEVRSAISQRQQQLAERNTWLAEQGIPLIETGSSQSSPREIRIERRVAPSRSKPEGEPVLADAEYAFILAVIGAKARSMERMRGNYASWDEPALRDDLIAVLNTHYPGDVTGETFNRGGKTDILVRVEDANVFIGECKWWGGRKQLRDDDLPQLLGYRTWRDSKLALIYFCDRKDIHGVRDSVKAELAEAATFVRWTAAVGDELRCELHESENVDKRMTLAVEFVDLHD